MIPEYIYEDQINHLRICRNCGGFRMISPATSGPASIFMCSVSIPPMPVSSVSEEGRAAYSGYDQEGLDLLYLQDRVKMI